MAGGKFIPFPVLKAGELVQCFQQSNIPLMESDITKPTPQALERIFKVIMGPIMGVEYGHLSSSPERNDLLVESIDAVTENPEFYIESLPYMTFYREMWVLYLSLGAFILTD